MPRAPKSHKPKSHTPNSHTPKSHTPLIPVLYLTYLASQISVSHPRHRSEDQETNVSVCYISVSRATVYMCICVSLKSTTCTATNVTSSQIEHRVNIVHALAWIPSGTHVESLPVGYSSLLHTAHILHRRT
jgi:hypothetical protein